MKGVEVYCQLGGDEFVVHRIGSCGGVQEFQTVRGNHTIEVNTGHAMKGYSASNYTGNGGYYWIFIPMDVIGTFEFSERGSRRKFKFSDCIIGPSYHDWYSGWWEDGR